MSPVLRRSFVCTVLGFLGVLSSVFAQDQTYRFNLPAQSLETSLRAVGRQAGINILFDSRQVEGLSAPALRAEVTIQEAVRRLTENKSLTVQQPSADTITVSSLREAQRGDIQVVRVAEAPVSAVPASDKTPSTAGGDRKSAAAEVIVTGTSLRGGVAPESSPVLVFTRKDIEASGQTTVENFMRNVPQNFSGGISQENYNASGTGMVASKQGAGVNLRGLGQVATLVLLNGRRMAPSGERGEFVDVSLIPLSAIERIEILTNGASAIYGSDAVGGVVNYILRENFDGFETALHAGTATTGDGDQLQLAQTAGARWNDGSALLTYEYRSEDAVLMKDRDFTINMAPDRLFLPEEQRHSVLVSAKQQFGDRLSLDVMGGYLKRDTRRDSVSLAQVLTESDADANSRTVSAGLGFDLSAAWRLEASGSYSRMYARSTNVSPTSSNNSTAVNEITESGLKLAGDLLTLPAGVVQFAAGVQLRTESYDNFFISRSGATTSAPTIGKAKRDIHAAFSEVLIPLVSERNRRRGLERLELSAAGRYEDYERVGDTFDPKYGVLWSPMEGLSVRATYDTSFRAPVLAETLGLYNAFYYPAALLFADPAQAAGFPLLLFGYGTDIDPETSETWTAGIDLRPQFLPQLRVSLNYFSTDYTNRIARPSSATNLIGNPAFESIVFRAPSPALVQSVLGSALQVFDFSGPGFTSGGRVPADITVILDNRIDNSAVTKTHGLDVGVDYRFAFGAHEFTATANATRLYAFENQLTALAPAVETVNTAFNPAKLRLRSGLSWAHRNWSGNLFLNHVGSYEDPRYTPVRPVDAYETFDLTLAYSPQSDNPIWRGTRLSFSALNLFDTDPPALSLPPGATSDVGYDPVNASGRGRFVSLQLKKSW